MDDVEEIIAQLVDEGILSPDGMEGEDFVYKVDLISMKEKYPALYEIFLEDMDETLLSLLKEGLVEVEYNENLEALFSVSEKGLALAKQLEDQIGDYNE